MYSQSSKLLVKVILASGLTFAASAAHAADYCTNKYREAAKAVQTTYEPEIADVFGQIKRVQDAGLDPNAYYVPYRGQLVTLVQKANNIVLSYRDEMSRASGRADGCTGAVAPANLLVNGAVKASLIWASYGLALLLPDRMTNIDVGEIAHGKPFGGDKALIPAAREQLLGGNRGTIANVIRDPWKCATFQRKC